MTAPRLTRAQRDPLAVLAGCFEDGRGTDMVEFHIAAALSNPRGGIVRSLHRLEREGYVEPAGDHRWQITEVGRARHEAVGARSRIR